MIGTIIKKYKFDKHSDKLGSDCPFTHWRLYFRPLMYKLSKKKFMYFGNNAEFRTGAYANYLLKN